MLVRVPLFSMFASCFGISTISYIVEKDQTYPRFDKKIIFGAFALLFTIGYISLTIVKTCFTLSDVLHVTHMKSELRTCHDKKELDSINLIVNRWNNLPVTPS